MIYVIGDIHGMSDPLKIVLDYIRQEALQGIPVTRIVFLGDYVDAGPASRQVVDSIMQLRQEFEVVTLLGNHEEMLLSYYHKTLNYGAVGNYWLNYNGGLQTVLSFYPQSPLFKTTLYPDEQAVKDILLQEDVLVLDKTYEEFFDGLRASYTHTVTFADREYHLMFCHAVPSVRFPLEEQAALANWKDVHAYISEKGMSLEETHIWNRQLLTQHISPDTIVIHGHTPTRYYRQMSKLLKFWEDEDNSPFVMRDKRTKQPCQIDIDTGLVYGGSLTMLAIEDSSQGEKVFPYYISVDPKRGFRNKLFVKQPLDLG